DSYDPPRKYEVKPSWMPAGIKTASRSISPLHLPVPVLRLGIHGTENFHVPLPAAPRLDDFGRDAVDQNLGKLAPFRVAFEMVRRLIPAEIRVEHQGEEQVVAVVHDNQLAARPLLRGMVDQIFFGAVRPDVALEGELAGDDFLDRDFLVPAVAAVLFLATRLRHFLGAAQRTPRLCDRLAWHGPIVAQGPSPTAPRPLDRTLTSRPSCPRAPARTSSRRTP